MLPVRVRPFLLFGPSRVLLSALPLSSTEWRWLNMHLLLRPPSSDKGPSFIVFAKDVWYWLGLHKFFGNHYWKQPPPSLG